MGGSWGERGGESVRPLDDINSQMAKLQSDRPTPKLLGGQLAKYLEKKVKSKELEYKHTKNLQEQDLPAREFANGQD